jgi:hypothetical protein
VTDSGEAVLNQLEMPLGDSTASGFAATRSHTVYT